MSTITNSTRLKRLRHLRKVLAAVPRNQFNWGEWGYQWSQFELNNPKKHQCGTFACVLGWASLDKTFNRAGLKGEFVPERGENGHECAIKDGKIAVSSSLRITHKEWSGPEAGTVFFGLEYYEQASLFYGHDADSDDKKGALKLVDRLIKRFKGDWKAARREDEERGEFTG